MAFGGYKFAGFRVDNSQYADVTNRCLAIHAARVRAFLTASGLAGNPWTADNDKLSGELDLNVGTGAIVSGVNNGVIHILKNINNVTKAYSSYFKYSSGDVTGYYYILTMLDYGIGDSTDSGYIKLNKNTCLQRHGTSYSANYGFYGPYKASCFHCFSLEPFPSSLSPADLDLTGMKATRLCSIGTNALGNITSSVMSGGYVNNSELISLFGYAIKDTDIISFAGSGSTNSYTNPFSTGTGGQVSVLSLNGFSELYNPNDIYKLLQYDVRNYSYYTSSSSLSDLYDEIYTSDYSRRGAADQVLDPQSGAPLVDIDGAHTVQVCVLSDARTFYNPSGAQTTPYSGLQFCLADAAYSGRKPIPFSNSTQYIKGSTNPELLAMNVSYSALSYSKYSPSIDGNLLFTNSAYANGYGTQLNPNDYQMGGGSATPNLGSVHYNFFIGWDASNPDIKTDSAWPEYNATV